VNVADIDFARFDRVLSALLKGMEAEAKAARGGGRQAQVQEPIPLSPPRSSPLSPPKAPQLVEGHKLRNSRDLRDLHAHRRREDAKADEAEETGGAGEIEVVASPVDIGMGGLSLGGTGNLLVPFLMQLWGGVELKVVYSVKPLVEKMRVVYLRASVDRSNKTIRECLASIAADADGVVKRGDALLDAVAAISLNLCWGRRSVIGHLSHSQDKSIDVDALKHIKVGSGQWAQCINVGSSGKTLVLKIEETHTFRWMLDGITALMASRV